jgi:ketosteroid isomerase-like protein
MKIGVNSETSQVDLYRSRVARHLIACLALIFISLMIETAAAAPEDEVRATFDRFIAAQNAHDVKAVESLLLSSPDFLWITRGMPVWGPDAARKRFAVLYEGTWKLDPEFANLKVIMIGDSVAQIYVPIIFTIGAPGYPARALVLVQRVRNRTFGYPRHAPSLTASDGLALLNRAWDFRSDFARMAEMFFLETGNRRGRQDQGI